MNLTNPYIFAAAFLCLSPAVTSHSSLDVPAPAYHAITKLQPGLTVARAERLARTFTHVAVDCGIDWRLLVSIAYHESSLGIQLVNARTRDYGIMQVNQKNVLRYSLSQDRLMKDAAYSIRFACGLLKDNRARYGSKYPYWLGIYRSGTALWKNDIRDNAQRYDRIIRRTARSLGYHE